MKSVLRAPLYRRKGGLVPGAKSFSSSGFLHSKNMSSQCVAFRVWKNSSITWCNYWLSFVSESGQWWLITLSNGSLFIKQSTRMWAWLSVTKARRMSDWRDFICLMQTVITKTKRHRCDSYVVMRIHHDKRSIMDRTSTYFLMSTVVTVNLTPLSHSTMKRLWQKGQFPTFSPSWPAWRHTAQLCV